MLSRGSFEAHSENTLYLSVRKPSITCMIIHDNPYQCGRLDEAYIFVLILELDIDCPFLNITQGKSVIV